MILIDSSVWIDVIRGIQTPETKRLAALADLEPLAIGDLNLVEVLQGCANEISLARTRRELDAFEVLTIGGEDIAVQAARNFIYLRQRGITIRKTIDTLIATRCIVDGIPLLHRDRDFQPFVDHLGLIDAMA